MQSIMQSMISIKELDEHLSHWFPSDKKQIECGSAFDTILSPCLDEISPGVFRNKSNGETMIDVLHQIRHKLNQLSISPCGFPGNMVQFPQGTPFLENCTETTAQNAIDQKGDTSMASYLRLRVCIGYNDDGSHIVKQVGARSETELADKVARTLIQSERRTEFIELLPAAPDGTRTMKKVVKFREYADKWFTTFKVGKLKPTTEKGYRVMLNAHLFPAWADTPLDQIDATAIQKFLDDRKELSRKYLRDLKNFLSQILESAKLDKLIPDNPCKDSRIENPSDKVTTRQPVPEASVREIISKLHLLDDDPKAQKYLALVIFTGARKGEILGLRYEDIDREANVIHVRRNVTTTSNKPIVGTPKTKAGYRDIPILAGLMEYIKGGDPSNYIVTDSDTPLTQSAHARMMQRINKRIGLGNATSHCFRHTMGTLLADTGANVKTIQSILGQTDFKTTADRYVHPRKEREIEAASKVNDLLCAGNA